MITEKTLAGMSSIATPVRASVLPETVHVAVWFGSPEDLSVWTPVAKADPPVNFRIESPDAHTVEVCGSKSVRAVGLTGSAITAEPASIPMATRPEATIAVRARRGKTRFDRSFMDMTCMDMISLSEAGSGGSNSHASNSFG